MNPIRLRKDNVVHAVHTTVDRVRLATEADVQRTAANPNGFGWPCCWACTDKRMRERKDGKLVGAFGEMQWVPVEGYAIVDQRENEEDLRAECSHGNPGGRVYVETKIFTMPRAWSDTKKRHKRASLMFFVASEAEPMSNLVLL